MSPDVQFFVSLGTTLAILVAVVVTGFQAKRRIHLTLVACAVAMLGTTIYFAERLGNYYDLEAAGWITPVHLTLAKIATVSYLLPVITGLRVLKDPSRRKAHRGAAYLVLTLSLMTFGTGLWMLMASERLPL